MVKKQLAPVIKLYMRGSWHGKDATRKGLRMIFSILFVSFLYLLLGMLLSFNSLVLRILSSFIIVAVAALYLYVQGVNSGEADTAYGEIIYQHEQDGKPIARVDRERCFHPAKGFYIALIALIPYLLLTLLFAVLAEPLKYSLGVLPTWLESAARQTHVGEALAYYSAQEASMLMFVLRIAGRAVTMPFINIALLLGTNGVLWAERLTPVWVSIAPIAYAIGYLQGPKMRVKINTGIEIGLRAKRRKARKARNARVAVKKPEQLI
jgi:hypothetical protein